MRTVYDLSNGVHWEEIHKKIYADTNIISPIYYDQSAAVPNQVNLTTSGIYQQTIRNMFVAGAKLHLTSLTILEMLHLFTRWDHIIYNRTHRTCKIEKMKEYREVQSEMQNRCSRYSLIYQQIEETKEIIIEDTSVCSAWLKNYIGSMDRQSMDSTDYAIAAYLDNKNAILMTDDRDFGVPMGNYDLMTSNQVLINRCIQNGYTVK